MAESNGAGEKKPSRLLEMLDLTEEKNVKAFATIASLLLILAGSIVLSGWVFDVAALKEMFLSWGVMKANTAVSFILLGAALFLLRSPARNGKLGRNTKIAVYLCALIVFTIGFMTTLEYFSGMSFGIDEALFKDTASTALISAPGRMGLNTALNFALIGISIIFLVFKKKNPPQYSQMLLFIASIITAIALVGYVTGEAAAYGDLPGLTAMSISALALFMVCLFALFLIQIRYGFISLLSSRNQGGGVLRRILPIFVLSILLIELAKRTLGAVTIISPVLISAALIITQIFIAIVLVWAVARQIEQIGIKQKEYEEEIKEMVSLVKGANMVVIGKDLDGKITSWNEGAEEFYGYKAKEVIGKPMDVMIPKEKINEFKEVLAKIKKGEKVPAYETTRLKKGGKKVDVIVSTSPVRDEHGVLIGISTISQDITKQKELDEKMKASEEKFRGLFESSGDAIMTLEPPSWKFTSGNPAALRMFNVKDEKKFTSLGPGQVSPKFQPDGQLSSVKAKKAIGKAMKDGRNLFEWTHRRRNGKDFPATILLSRMKDREKVYLQATVRDITEQKEAQEKVDKAQEKINAAQKKADEAQKKANKVGEKVNESEEKFRRLFEGAHDGVLLLDVDTGKITDSNPFIEALLGYSKKEMLGKQVWQISPFRNIFANKQKFIELQKKGSVHYQDLPLETKSGKVAYVEFVSNVYSAGGKKVIQCNIRDVTETKELSEYARGLIEASLDPLVTISPTGKITDANNAAIKVTGLSKEKLVGTDFSDYFTKPGKARAGYKKVFKKGFIADYPLTVRHKSGKQTDVLYNASLYKDAKGNVLGIVAVARDVTEKKKIEDKVKEVQRKADEAQDKADKAQLVINETQKRADKAQKIADIAQKKSDEAQIIINKTLKKADIAQKKANEVQKIADKAQLVINETQRRADVAQEKSDKAQVIINTALKKADIAQKKSDKAQIIINKTQKIADIAQKKSDEVQKIANIAQKKSDKAQVVINETQKKANVAQDKADKAQLVINKTQKIADAAQDKSDKAQVIINETQRKADEAQKKANEVQKIADKAQLVINETQKRADAAQRKADEAQEKANKAEEKVNESEGKFRSLFDGSFDAIFIMDFATRKLVDCSRSAEALTGYSREEILSMKADNLHPKDMAKKMMEDMEKLLAGKIKSAVLEVLTKEGNKIQVNIEALNVQIGGKKHAQLIVRDITESVKISKMKDDLVSIASHELRTPLTSVTSVNQLMLDDKLGPITDIQRKYLGLAQKDAARLKELIETLLDVTRIEGGTAKYDFEKANIAHLLGDVVSTASATASEREMKISIAPFSPVVAEIDRPRIQRVLINLITNAIKYGKLGGHIWISAKKTDNRVVIAIKDDGRGISKENLPLLFTKMFQVGSKSERVVGGLGFGLYICKSIVEEGHHGKIWVESGLGKGSTFYVQLPLRHARKRLSKGI